MLRRLLVGLLKGLVVGAALGALMHFALGMGQVAQSWINYLLYGAVALLAGVFAGQPPWRQGAWISSILKGLFGFGVGAGLFALASHFLRLPVGGLAGIPTGTTLAQAPLLFAPIVAAVYAGLVELDDGGPAAVESKTGVRVSADEVLAAIPDEDEDERPAAAAKKKGRASR